MLDTYLREAEQTRKRITVYGSEETDLASRLATRNVAVEHRRLPAERPGPFLTIHQGEEFLGAIELDGLETLLEPPLVEPGADSDPAPDYRALSGLFTDTVFTSLDRHQLLATTREIEDRAYRVGNGTLRVGFQRLAVFETQVPVYRRLAGETALDIHIYGKPDWTPPEISGVTYHTPDHGDVSRFWFVAFDGGDDPCQSCALLAEETADGFSGYWTYDEHLVAEIIGDVEREWD